MRLLPLAEDVTKTMARSVSAMEEQQSSSSWEDSNPAEVCVGVPLAGWLRYVGM
jgi:hypothetical protein